MKLRWLFLFGALLAIGAAERVAPPKPLPPEEAARQGRALVNQLLSQRPAQDLTNSGVLKIRDARGQRVEIPVEFRVVTTTTNWSSVYLALPITNQPGGARQSMKLVVVHADDSPNKYSVSYDNRTTNFRDSDKDNAMTLPFAGSDFWVADLGLEFLHWPEQRLLRKEIRRGQSCDVLESINPHRGRGTYARVMSWIDIDTGGIIYAEAYDTQDRLLKEFLPKSVKKVRGEWRLREMRMENRQTGSRTWIEFNFGED